VIGGDFVDFMTLFGERPSELFCDSEGQGSELGLGLGLDLEPGLGLEPAMLPAVSNLVDVAVVDVKKLLDGLGEKKTLVQAFSINGEARLNVIRSEEDVFVESEFVKNFWFYVVDDTFLSPEGGGLS
jgi:hypothetical protein